MLVQASTLPLLPPSLSSSSSAKPICLLFDPASQSLAVTLSDSSILLFSSFSHSSPLSSPPLSIPPVSSSACFLLLNPNRNPISGRPLFLSAFPHQSSSATLLRAWIRRSKSDLFTPVALSFKKRIGRLGGVTLDLRHGFGVTVAGSVNVLVVHSVAERQIWVLGLRIDGGEGDEMVELVKCAVIECSLPIYEVEVSMGVLVLGEVGGVRVFPLRLMVKGGHGLKTKKRRDLNMMCEGAGEQRTRGKLRTLKLRQDSNDSSSFFVMMTCAAVQDSESDKGVQASLKAAAIHVLSQKKFLIVDSVGDIYLLSLQNTVLAPEATVRSSIISASYQINCLNVTMKVQLLAVLADMSAKMQVLWLSDGAHTVHVMSVSGIEHSARESDENGNKEKEMLISATQVIFTSEQVQDIVPLSANAILILGQGNIFSYSIA